MLFFGPLYFSTLERVRKHERSFSVDGNAEVEDLYFFGAPGEPFSMPCAPSKHFDD